MLLKGAVSWNMFTLLVPRLLVVANPLQTSFLRIGFSGARSVVAAAALGGVFVASKKVRKDTKSTSFGTWCTPKTKRYFSKVAAA